MLPPEPTPCADAAQEAEDIARIVVTTSTLEDWLWRGDDPVLQPMSWQVYSMWVYRIERPALQGARAAFERQRFIDMPFAVDYVLHGSHLQRMATELRVPLFEGFTMPPSVHDSETAAYYKQLLTRPLFVPAGGDAAESKLLSAFMPLCEELAGHVTMQCIDACLSHCFHGMSPMHWT